jgi:hypothetical protein
VATDKQIAANRLNAQKSTGPKTPEGRAAVRLNGVKYGLHAETLVLKGESESDFTALLDSYEAEHAPATPTEEALVVQLAMAAWRLRRLYHAEAAFYTKEMTFLAYLNSEKKLDGHTLTGLTVNANCTTVDTFRRQEASLERSFCRALQELKHLRSQRRKDLALVSHTEPTTQPQASTTEQINDIQPPTTDPTPANPAPDADPSPENAIHLVPPTDDMQ